MSHGAQPLVLAPSTPAAFLEHILTQRSHPTTVLICAARHDFLNAAVSEMQDSAATSSHHRPLHTANDDTPDKTHLLLRATLAQIATARHMHTVFLPSVVHLRAYLSVFPSTVGKPVSAPPVPAAATQKEQPALLVYGFLDVHRDGSEWSAQGIGCSAAALVEAAARAGFAAVLMEPTGWEEEEASDEREGKNNRWAAAYGEQIPVLSTTASVREDGTWGVPCTTAKTILRRWFTFNDV